MSKRQAEILRFLKEHGWEDSTRSIVQGDASFRRYERLYHNGKKAILMDAPPGKEDVRPFIRIGNYLKRHNFSAPQIYASDIANGFLLLEDFGDDVYGKLLTEGKKEGISEEDLYGYAIDVLAQLHDIPLPDNTPIYSKATLLQEASLLTFWYLPIFLTDKEQLEEAKNAYNQAWEEVLSYPVSLPDALLLRDYHSPNLMWLSEREGIQRVGLLDFQDAVIGSPAYDVVSLLEDARRDVDPAIIHPLLNRYFAAKPKINKEDFLASYAMLGAQRNCKVIGFLSKKLYYENNNNYISLLPRAWRHLSIDLQHPVTAPIKAWIDRYIPKEKRDITTLCSRHKLYAET